jgi:hypothetical protein
LRGSLSDYPSLDGRLGRLAEERRGKGEGEEYLLSPFEKGGLRGILRAI